MTTRFLESRSGMVETPRLQATPLGGPKGRHMSARISDFAVVPYRQDQSPRLDFWGSDVRNLTTEGDTRWVNYNTSHFSSRSTAS